MYDRSVSESIPRDRVIQELHALRDASRELQRRLDALIGEVEGETTSDPRVVEIARRAIEELRAKQRARRLPTALVRPTAPPPRLGNPRRSPKGE